ncbi:hypothetical protein [Terrihabitans rhizophilus]|uniref:hypothetical protein n=1 Tax=Terrihabitans rhizophilus TaxID=3092662 RepID=UPI0029DE6E7E|nr:hypothetical protein [Terrihabitans sp. PJ23]
MSDAPMISPENTLLCIFSYNMGRSLQICLGSIEEMCPNFPVIICDDSSEDPATRNVLATWMDGGGSVWTNNAPKLGKRHGNLYENIGHMLNTAEARGFTYILMIQDDMQFVRPLTSEICRQYSDLFESSRNVVQVDIRFLRRGSYRVLPDLRAYDNGPGTAYADVGLTHIGRLKASGWRLDEGERANRDGLAALGYRRLFPFSAVAMHVPFPRTYRKGKPKLSLLPFRRGRYSFRSMTAQEILDMDARPLDQPPLFRTFLHPKDMTLSRLVYWCRKDTKIFN